jgi:hypothetical protein
MSQEACARLRRDLTIVTALERLLERELARTGHPMRPRQPDEWFAGQMSAFVDAATGEMETLRDRLETERLSLTEELGVEDCSTEQAEAEAESDLAPRASG